MLARDGAVRYHRRASSWKMGAVSTKQETNPYPGGDRRIGKEGIDIGNLRTTRGKSLRGLILPAERWRERSISATPDSRFAGSTSALVPSTSSVFGPS